MDAARFVSYGFIYAGAVFLLQWLLHPDPMALEQGGIFSLLSALIFGAGGLYRRFGPDEAERSPDEYGPFTYVFAALLVVLTGLLFTQFVVR